MNKSDQIYEYSTLYSGAEASYLAELRRETYLKELRPHMVSGPLQGKLLQVLVSLCSSESVLEIGTFTGYATLCMAAGLEGKGRVHTVEIEEELAYYHDKYFPMSGLSEKIDCYYQDANEFIKETALTFDFVFMDAGKKDYQSQIDSLLTKMRKGAVILADNVLWKGKVADAEKDKMTERIHSFNTYVKNHPQLENVILPIRDGINIIRKVSD